MHGPNVANFFDVYALLDEVGGAATVGDADQMAAALINLFADPGKLRAMARSAAKAVEAQGGAAERIIQAIKPLLRADEPPAAA